VGSAVGGSEAAVGAPTAAKASSHLPGQISLKLALTVQVAQLGHKPEVSQNDEGLQCRCALQPVGAATGANVCDVGLPVPHLPGRTLSMLTTTQSTGNTASTPQSTQKLEALQNEKEPQ
jgi:hypothetical protein